jgi:hypothetical protein
MSNKDLRRNPSDMALTASDMTADSADFALPERYWPDWDDDRSLVREINRWRLAHRARAAAQRQRMRGWVRLMAGDRLLSWLHLEENANAR